MSRRRVFVVCATFATIALFAVPGPVRAQAPAPQTGDADTPRTVWYFYKVRWGAQDRFVDLFRRNHHPVLEAQLGTRLVSIKAYVPTYHGDGRADWTFAVALTFRNTAALVQRVDEQALARKLFADYERWQREERERFELLEAHWDVPLNEIELLQGKVAQR